AVAAAGGRRVARECDGSVVFEIERADNGVAELVHVERVRDALRGEVVDDDAARRRRPALETRSLDPGDVMTGCGDVRVFDAPRCGDGRGSDPDARLAAHGLRVRNGLPGHV